jgi:dihydroorotase
MGQLFQSLQILNENGLQNQATDILIENGTIVAIGQNLSINGHDVVDAKNWIVSLGWKDCFTVCRVPGSEHKDTINSLVKSAHLGGYTELLLVSGGATPIDSAVKVEFISQNFKNHALKIHTSGTISYKQEGKEITEMYDMFLSGAKFFSDGIQHLKNPELLKRALLYTQTFESKLMVYSEDSYMSENGMVNEGEVSAVLGMKTRPALSEEIAVIRNIYISQYTNRPIHLSGISSARSVEIIREAKLKGIAVTADVSIANLFFTDEVLKDFDTQYKVLPVLRTAKDKEALLNGVLDGTIDLVASHHAPQDNESKDCEFDLADFGSSNLEFTAAALWKILGGNAEKFYDLMYTKPSLFLNQEVQKLQVGAKANLSFFSVENQNIDSQMFKGPSKSSIFTGETLPLKVKGVCIEGKFIQL